jgi:inner membrane protein
LGGVLAGELLARHVGLPAGPAGLLVLAAGGVGALLPDADHPNSFAGRRLPLVSDLAFHALGHRGALHSLLACLLAYMAVRWLLALLPLAAPGAALLAAALALGYLSHLVLDALNPQGVRPFWPLPWRLALPLAESGGILERAAAMPVLSLVCLHLFLQMPGVFGEAWDELTGALGLPAGMWGLLRKFLDAAKSFLA